MSDILTDFSQPALIHAVKANLLEAFHYLRQAAQTAFTADEKFTRWHTRVPHPWFNGVSAAQPPAPEDEAFIEDTIAYFRSCGVSPFTWWIAPAVPFGPWQEVLCRHGFHVDHDTPGMALDLERLPPDWPAPPTLKIVPVDNLDQLKTWTQTFIAGYELPLAWAADFYDLAAGQGLDWPLRHYLGYLDGEPAAASTLFLGAGVAGAYDVATVPHARGRGLGTALTCVPLTEARALGYRVGVLQSSEMGYPIYQRLGFQKVGDMDHFYRATDLDLEP
jgi:GNAT superfamily N-acetyltransferase